MTIFKNLLGIREIKGPLFYKDFNEESRQLDELIKLSNTVKSNKKHFIERDIEFLKAGIKGEKNVYYELKNSFIPMIVLHDIRIQDGDYIAQLDFVIVTAQFIMVLETKKMNGDIYINESGDFVRSIKNKYGKVIKKEGIYSPIAQNDRHVRIVKNLLIKNGMIKRMNVLSGVVIANEKSIVNKSRASQEIKEKIFRFDQITDILNSRIDEYKKSIEIFEYKMKEIAEFFIVNNKSVRFDYIKKYSLSKEDFVEYKITDDIVKAVNEDLIEEVEINKVEDENSSIKSYDDTYSALKEYRLNKSREQNVKPYFIYNNEMLDQIIKLKPTNKDELIEIKGFGSIKIEKYGQDIIDIIRG